MEEIAIVRIHIIPNNREDLEDLGSYNPKEDGSILSTETEIRVNRASYGYTIIYDEQTFTKLKASRLVSSIVSVFAKNLPNTIVELGVTYHQDEDTIKPEVVSGVMILIRLINSVAGTTIHTLLAGTNNAAEIVENMHLHDAVEDDDDDEDEDDGADEDDLNFDDPLSLALGACIFDDDDDDDDYPRHHKPKNDGYGRSRVWREAKNPKRAIRRHGVLIAASKDDLKKDEKTIKEFLKDFIPGDAEWKREFRSDVAKRWVQMFAISKKQLKYLERRHRKAQEKKNRDPSSTDRALDFTRRLFSVSTDKWSDPNR